jgi:uncharacterized protein (DUF1330 family)
MFKPIIAFLLAVTLCFPMVGQAQPAQASAQLPGYLLVVGKTTDRAKIGAYVAALPAIYAQHNGRYLALGGAGRGVAFLEGPWSDRSLILANFPNRSAIDAFWWGEAYRNAIRKRDNAGVFSVVALTGSRALPFDGNNVGYLIVMTGPRDASPAQANASEAAAQALQDSVTAAGGVFLTSTQAGQFTSMEGDTVFDRFIIAAWPNLTVRDAYLASASARRTARLRARVGYSVVISANGLARPQTPPTDR